MIGERPINELAIALAMAQSEIKHAEKSAENPAFKRDGKPMKYATLADVWDACREPLTRNKLSIVQLPHRTENGVSVTTILMHASGQYIESSLEVPAGNTAQSFGSAITYARRYTLASIVGIAPDEDDDGANASAGGGQQYRERPQQQQRRTETTSSSAGDQAFESKNDAGVTNIVELRQLCESRSAKLKKMMRISLKEMRREARVAEEGPLSPEAIVKFLRWADERLRQLAPDDDPLPDWSDGSQRNLDDEIDNPSSRVNGRAQH